MSDAGAGRRARLFKLGWLLLALLLIGFAFFLWRLWPKPVKAVHPKERPVVQSVAVTGSVFGAQESDLAPSQPGVLERLLVTEGERVRKGQKLAYATAVVPTAQLKQAEAAVRVARAQLREASAPNLASEIEQARAEVRGAVGQAQAQLNAAVERLRELEAGGTEAQRLAALAQLREAEARYVQAQREVTRAAALAETNATARAALEQARTTLAAANARVAQTRVALEQAELNLSRMEILYRQGVVARAELDTARTTANSARQDLQQAIAQRDQAQVGVAEQQRLLAVTRLTELQRAQADLEAARQTVVAARANLQQIEEAARPEVLAQQRAQVAAARAALIQAREAGQARIRTLLATPRPEHVAVAARQYEQALRARDVARAQLRTYALVAPYAGMVTEIVSRPGDAIGQAQPILRFSQMQAPEVRVDVDEKNLPDLRVGQSALITADAFPENTLGGRVIEVAPRADPQRGTVQVTIRLRDMPRWLRSGMTVDANIIVAPRREHLIVPTTAILRQGDHTYVLVIAQGHVRRRPVVLGESGVAGAVVLAGLRERDWVVVESTAVKPGQAARPAR